MSWFYGHLFPGISWWFFGIYIWIQSLHRLSWTKKFRTEPRWLAFRSAGVMIAAFLGTLGEIIVPILDKKDVNTGHIIVWFGFTVSALTELLHMYKVLNEPVWALFSAAGLSFVSLMFQFHDQPLVYWTYLHLATSYATIPLVLVLGIWAVRGTSIANKMRKKNKALGEGNSNGWFFFWRGRTVDDLNPLYTEQSVYETSLPGLLAFFLMLQGCLWLEMLWEMGWYTMDNLPHEHSSHPLHNAHRMLETLIKDIMICFVVMIALSSVAQTIENAKKNREGQSVLS